MRDRFLRAVDGFGALMSHPVCDRCLIALFVGAAVMIVAGLS